LIGATGKCERLDPGNGGKAVEENGAEQPDGIDAAATTVGDGFAGGDVAGVEIVNVAAAAAIKGIGVRAAIERVVGIAGMDEVVAALPIERIADKVCELPDAAAGKAGEVGTVASAVSPLAVPVKVVICVFLLGSPEQVRRIP